MSQPAPVDRGIVWWYGGKGNMAGRLLPLIPYDRLYVEPFGGAASMLFARRPSPVEVYNDLHGDLVNLFRVMQCPEQYQVLRFRLRSTLYSRAEFELALETLRESSDPVDRAWAFFTAQRQGFSGKANTAGDWGRVITASVRGMAATASRWQSAIALLPAWRARIMRVQIEQRDALYCIRHYDHPQAVIYCDPPYVHDTRQSVADYAHEMTLDQHAALVEALLACAGTVVLSCYDHPVYAPLADAGWERHEFATAAYAAGRTRKSALQGAGTALAGVPRTEVVYRNRAGGGQLSLL